MNITLPPLTHINRLLIIKTSSIGDVIHALPVAQALKEARPELLLGWTVRARCADILRGNPFIDHLHVVPDKPNLAELLAYRRAMRSVRYEIALDMQGLFLSGLLTQLSGAPVRVGWDRNRELNSLFLTHPIVPGRDIARHEVDALYGFAEAVGGHPVRGAFPAQSYLAQTPWQTALPSPRIALNVGASRAYKRWPIEHWAELANTLAAEGNALVFVGSKTDADSAAEVRALMNNTSMLEDWTGKTTLRELASMLARCDVVVSGDTGPMHLAVAVGTPVVAIYGGTDPRRHGPYGTRSFILHHPQPGGTPSRRPTDEYGMACMRAVTPAEVLEAVHETLRARYTANA